jgi:hypothetical protein
MKKSKSKSSPSLPPAARALARRIGLSPVPSALRFSLAFHGRKQGDFKPPSYRLEVDTTKTPWLTVRHYNVEPHEVSVAQVRAPVEMSSYSLKTPIAKHRPALVAWAKALLEQAG